MLHPGQYFEEDPCKELALQQQQQPSASPLVAWNPGGSGSSPREHSHNPPLFQTRALLWAESCLVIGIWQDVALPIPQLVSRYLNMFKRIHLGGSWKACPRADSSRLGRICSAPGTRCVFSLYTPDFFGLYMIIFRSSSITQLQSLPLSAAPAGTGVSASCDWELWNEMKLVN